MLWSRPVPWDALFVLQELDSQIDHLLESLDLAALLGDARTAHLDAEIARARREEASTRTQLAAREQQRRELLAQLPAATVTRYEELRARLRGHTWVVALAGSSCPACAAALPSKLLAESKKGGQPPGCPACGRLLVRRRGS